MKFNGAISAAVQTHNGDTLIFAIVPEGATTGPISVTTAGGTATSLSNFYVPARIGGFTPGGGFPGTSVTITGSNFTGATSVAFYGAYADYTVQSDSTIVAVVPVGAATGPIIVTTPAGTVSSSLDFTVFQDFGPQ